MKSGTSFSRGSGGAGGVKLADMRCFHKLIRKVAVLSHADTTETRNSRRAKLCELYAHAHTEYPQGLRLSHEEGLENKTKIFVDGAHNPSCLAFLCSPLNSKTVTVDDIGRLN